MPTATLQAPTATLVSDAYADLAAELRSLAARITSEREDGGLFGSMSPATVVRAGDASRGFGAYIWRAVVVTLDLAFTLIVLPVLAFNVAMWLFPPVR